MEQHFSRETGRFRRQSGRSHVGQMIESRGAYVLRLQYSLPSEHDFDEILTHSENHLTHLRDCLQAQISAKSSRNREIQAPLQTSFNLLERLYGISVTNLISK